MSSIVKKASQFLPKLKKNAIRRSNSTNQTTPLTPPVSQIPIEDKVQNDKAQNDSEAHASAEATERVDDVELAKESNESTFKFYLDTSKRGENLQASLQIDDDIDPKDTSHKLKESAIEYSENESEEKSEDEVNYEDNDIFKKPDESMNSRRQSSILAQRRLSGITPNIIRNRSTSVSVTPKFTSPTDGQATSVAAPMRIGIPVNKPTKRRRSSIHQRSNKKSSLLLQASVIQHQKELGYKNDEDLNEIEESNQANGSKFIIGIDPQTNKLRKFRVSTGNDIDDIEIVEDGITIPVAPEDLDTNITSAKQLPKKIREEDMSLYAQVGVNIEEITMADLCKPNLPIGEVSNNFNLVKVAQSKIRKQRQQRRQDRRVARQNRVALEQVSQNNSPDPQIKKQNEDLLGLDDNEEHNAQHSTLKLTMKADGSIGYDEDSTIVNRSTRQNNSNKSVEESNPFENPITSSTYSKRKHTDRWTSEELHQFYEALSTWGTDFTFIAQLFPYRTRKQIKSKFNLEEKKYPEIIEMALKRKLPADFEKYCKYSKNKIETLDFYNEELRQVRIKHEEHMTLIAEERDKAIKEDAEASRRREYEIRTGSKPMTRAEKVKELRKNELVVGSIDDVKKQRQ